MSFDFQSHVYMDSYNRTIIKLLKIFAYLQNPFFRVP